MGMFMSKEKEANPEPSRFRRIENLEPYQLLCLGQDLNHIQDHLVTQYKLRQVINQLTVFDNVKDCEEYIHNMSSADQKVLLIIFGRLGYELVPRINDLKQLHAIYIYCMDVESNTEWTDHFEKVRSVFNDPEVMINKIKIDQRLRERTDESSLAISLYSESGDKNGDTLTERNAMFLSLQIFIDTILRMKQVPKKTKKELLDYLRNIYRDNDEQLRLIGEFERDYSPDRAIWWYTRSTFLYRVLNQALRCHDFDILIAFRFFISDLYKQLSKEHEKYLRAMKEPTIQVYRGQGINENELNLIRENVGEFISMNSFLSTTTNRDTAVFYAESNAAATDSVKPILFEFNIDQELMGAIPFASIRHLSYFQEEDEVLISLGNIFRIIEIKNTEENIWIAKLKLCSKTNFSLNEIFEYEMRDMPETPTLITLSRLLMQAGEYEKAKSVIQQIISESQNDLEKQNCYGLLGNIAVSQGDYDLALDNYLKCLEFQPEGDDGDSTFHWMKHIFELTGQHYCPELKSNLTLGLSKGALQLIPEDHEFSAVYYQNMGLSYSEKAEYDLALECFNKALNVQDKTLPEDHRDIGRIYSYTGNVYEEMEDYQMALKYYNESLRIYRKTLPPTHEDIQSSEENVKRMQEKM